MTEKKKRAPAGGQKKTGHYNGFNSVASNTGFTGLIPPLPDSEDETDSYSDIYDVPVSQVPDVRYEQEP